MTLSRSLNLVCVVVVAVVAMVTMSASLVSAGGGGKGVDLPVDGQLRIGVKHRPKVCTRKAKSGDSLTMHYTGSLYKVSG